MKSNIFFSDKYVEIQNKVQGFLNRHDDFLSARTAHSTRAAGDAIGEIISVNFEHFIGDICSEYSADFARRAMADFAFQVKNTA